MKTLLIALSLLASVATAAPHTDPKEAARSSYGVNVFPCKAENKLNVLLEKSAAKRLRVFLKDDRGNTVYEEFISKKARHFARRLDLSQLPGGRYNLTVSDGETQLHKAINLTASEPSQRIIRVD